jgi:hypothetical protein
MSRSTRERYRILSEEEFFADPSIALRDGRVASVALRDELRSHRHGSRGRRVAGVAMLLGAIASVAGVAAASVLVAHRQPRSARGSRRAPSSIALAVPPRPPAARAPRQAGRQRARSRLDRSPVRSARRTRRQRAAPSRLQAVGSLASAGAAAGADAAAGSDAPATADRRTFSAEPDVTASPRGAGEFGFER